MAHRTPRVPRDMDNLGHRDGMERRSAGATYVLARRPPAFDHGTVRGMRAPNPAGERRPEGSPRTRGLLRADGVLPRCRELRRQTSSGDENGAPPRRVTRMARGELRFEILTTWLRDSLPPWFGGSGPDVKPSRGSVAHRADGFPVDNWQCERPRREQRGRARTSRANLTCNRCSR